MKWKFYLVSLLTSALIASTTLGVTLPYTFTAGTQIKSAEVNADFAALASAINSINNNPPSLLRTNISGGTAYGMVVDDNQGKLTTLQPGGASNVSVSDGTQWRSQKLYNASLAPDAAITRVKLAGGTAFGVWVDDNRGYPTSIAPSTNGNVLTSDGTKWTSGTGAGAIADGSLTRYKILGATAYQMVLNDNQGYPAAGLSPGTSGKVAQSDGQLWTSALLTNSNLSSTAAIGRTKIAGGTAYGMVVDDNAGYMTTLAPGTSGNLAQSDGTSWISSTLPSQNASVIGSGTLATARGGTNTDSSAFTGLAHVSGGTWTASSLVNADVSSSAAIARTKLAGGTAYGVWVDDNTGYPTSVAPGASANVLTSDGTKWTSGSFSASSIANNSLSRYKTLGATAYQMVLNDNQGYPAAGLTPGTSGNVAQSDGQLWTSATLTNSNISSAAAISRLKIAGGTSYGVVVDDNTGLLNTIAPGTSGQIFKSDGISWSSSTISNSSVASNAAILRSKLDGATAYQVVMNDNNGFPTTGVTPGTSGNLLTSDGTKWTSAASTTGFTNTAIVLATSNGHGATATKCMNWSALEVCQGASSSSSSTACTTTDVTAALNDGTNSSFFTINTTGTYGICLEYVYGGAQPNCIVKNPSVTTNCQSQTASNILGSIDGSITLGETVCTNRYLVATDKVYAVDNGSGFTADAKTKFSIVRIH